ncbi:aminotransferase class I/II-fold pyridoxal phosphate-dependent enzyme, partial [Kineococcus sp. T13]|uniref:MocR-like pyridoxine biosynthesis transcription factor PdxR n=1 Tax=Kineococcus vitellinus TaxID=2696565 RepID=UPI001411D0C0|nr:aminotransferase class I/II-fold pyridoxal phosphate-dependent enzyme [Kineococcus vitellinus]
MDGSPRGTDFLQLDASGVPRRTLGGWLTGRLRAAVLDGTLAPGDALPAARTLAGDLGVSRGVVVGAYQRLAEEGLLLARVGSGTRVAAAHRPPPGAPGPAAGPAPAGAPFPVGSRPRRAVELDLWPGLPDLSAFPRAAWLRAERRALATAAAADLGYGDPRGHPRLRAELAGWLARTRGVRVHPDALLVTSGVAQALALLAQVLRARGHGAVAVEDPGSAGARAQLAHWGLAPVGLGVDADGVDVAQLRAAAADVAVVTPAHQFPTGVVLSPARRRELLAWAADGRDRLVVEDDYDAEHRYDRAPVPALQASAPERVAHTGSTSKTLAPGLRLGWLAAPAHLRADLLAARHAGDIAAPVLPQLALADLLATGQLQAHLRRVRLRQRARRVT